jgi:hypothetical protein
MNVMTLQVDSLELRKLSKIHTLQLAQFASSLQVCIDQALIDNTAGRAMACGLLSAFNSKQYHFSFNDMELLDHESASALLDVLMLKRSGAKIEQLIVGWNDFYSQLRNQMFLKKQGYSHPTVSVHPCVTNRQLHIMMEAAGCELRRNGIGGYMIQPRPVHSNTNIYKFPQRKRQFGATTPATPE